MSSLPKYCAVYSRHHHQRYSCQWRLLCMYPGVTIRYSSVMMICNQDIKEILSKMESHNLFTSFVCNVFCLQPFLYNIFVSVAGATQTLTYQKFAHPHCQCGSRWKQLTNFLLVGTCHLGNVIKMERLFSRSVAGEASRALFVLL
jgi:hypothetical protein